MMFTVSVNARCDGQPTFYYKPQYSSPQYSEAFADWMVEQYRADPEFFFKAREAAKKHQEIEYVTVQLANGGHTSSVRMVVIIVHERHSFRYSKHRNPWSVTSTAMIHPALADCWRKIWTGKNAPFLSSGKPLLCAPIMSGWQPLM